MHRLFSPARIVVMLVLLAFGASADYPVIRTSHMTLVALTAAPCPATQLSSRSAVSIYNGDGATIYVGPDANVTDATGFPVPAGAFQSYNLTFTSSPLAGQLWCYSVAGTGSGVVRILEIR